jgi:Carboxypeptidase regulatory-like domain
MKISRPFLCGFIGSLFLVAGCSQRSPQSTQTTQAQPPVIFKVDPASAASIKGTIHYNGAKPIPKRINMSEDPACVEANHGKRIFNESLLVVHGNTLANAFVFIEKGLEGKNFAVPQTPAVIDQRGCWFHPRVIGIQTSQPFQVVNSDPVTHNIHPMAHMNREWNHSQGPGEPPLNRKFAKPEIMIPVKCNIHSWMHAYIGVLDHPYFAVSNENGVFEIPNLPPGTYTLAVWQEQLGKLEQQIAINSGQIAVVDFTYKGK